MFSVVGNLYGFFFVGSILNDERGIYLLILILLILLAVYSCALVVMTIVSICRKNSIAR